LHETLTTTDIGNEVTGVITLNVADALFAIASALNRIAVIHERSQAMADQRIAQLEQMMFRSMGARQQ
jgi:hypothetical protein